MWQPQAPSIFHPPSFHLREEEAQRKTGKEAKAACWRTVAHAPSPLGFSGPVRQQAAEQHVLRGSLLCVWVAQPPWRIWRRPEEQIGGGLAWPGSGLAGTQACFPPGLPPAVPRTRWGPMRCPESARELASRVSPGQDCCSCCLELSVESFLCLKERPLVSAVRYPGI